MGKRHSRVMKTERKENPYKHQETGSKRLVPRNWLFLKEHPIASGPLPSPYLVGSTQLRQNMEDYR